MNNGKIRKIFHENGAKRDLNVNLRKNWDIERPTFFGEQACLYEGNEGKHIRV